MKGSFLLIDKIATIIVLLFIVIDIMPLMDIPLMAYFIPLIVMGLVRVLVVAIVIVLDLISWINESIKNIRVRNKN
jgi:hypothetical protein